MVWLMYSGICVRQGLTMWPYHPRVSVSRVLGFMGMCQYTWVFVDFFTVYQSLSYQGPTDFSKTQWTESPGHLFVS